MIGPTVEFALLAVDELHEHEETDPKEVRALAHRIRTRGVVDSPIWVARDSQVILNGHHRFRALKSLGVRRVPAWVIDYEDGPVTLERWKPGPPISKDEVVERGRLGRLFPRKTTRHLLTVELPERPTRLVELMDPPSPSAGQPEAPQLSPRGVRSADRG